MSATHATQSTASQGPVLYMAVELSLASWKLAFTVGSGQKPRIRSLAAGALASLMEEIKLAKKRFGLPDSANVMCCYEAGRDGFWIHRFLISQGVKNIVVDSASIEVNRRKRRAKSDRLDATKLVSMLIRWHNGEKKVWAVVRIPTVDDEDRRQLHRELIDLKAHRTEHANRIKGLLAGLGLKIVVDVHVPERLAALRQWDNKEVPPALRERILREFQRWQLVEQQIDELEAKRKDAIRNDQATEVQKVRQLIQLSGIGENGAWLLVREFFGWRGIRNRRELASLAGLSPTPYDSGGTRSEQGISKAGNRRVRWMMVELAWVWLQYQPRSELSRWFMRRFGQGNGRARKVGIVALARKLLIALWKYLETGEVPAGAKLNLKKSILRVKKVS
jgi:transposase